MQDEQDFSPADEAYKMAERTKFSAQTGFDGQYKWGNPAKMFFSIIFLFDAQGEAGLCIVGAAETKHFHSRPSDFFAVQAEPFSLVSK